VVDVLSGSGARRPDGHRQRQPRRLDAGRPRIVEHVRTGDRFAERVEPLLPDEETAFVVKARHSIFFETPLSYC
jgi:hypothetical protein